VDGCNDGRHTSGTILDAMPLYTLAEPDAPLTEPVIVAAFDGWIDAAGAATAAAERTADGAELIASFDADVLFDFRSRRPVLDVVDGRLEHLTWPELTMRRSHHERRDLLVLTGAEPDFRWQELGRDVVDLSKRLGVTQWVSLGSIPTAVPHTRPVPVLATASAEGLLAEDEQVGPAGLLRVPSAALSTLEMAAADAGIPAVGFYAQVPHYVGGPYAAASIAILEHLGRHLGVEPPLGELADDAMAQRERLDQIVQADDDSRTYVERLESVVDNQELPTGDELVGEIERFLQERGDGGGSPPGMR
jgi:proteasome assembly chaperone (PAC2) family protein